jgi:hypothetical protein
MEADTIVKGLPMVSDHFGKSLRQVQRWARQGMPRLSGGQYDLTQIRAWLSNSKKGRRKKYSSIQFVGELDWGQLTAIDGELLNLLNDGSKDIRRGLVTISTGFLLAKREDREQLRERLFLRLLGEVKVLLLLLKSWHQKSPIFPELF